MIPFHITDIHLDDDLDVSAVTALMDETDLDAFNQLIYPAGATDQELLEIRDRVRIERREPGSTVLLLRLDFQELMRLYRRVCRPDTPELPGAWDSLYRVVRSLIEPDEFPAETWDEHQRPDGAIWRGHLDQDENPELVGLPCRMDADGNDGAVTVSFFTGTVLHLDANTRFRILRSAHPVPRTTRTDEAAVAEWRTLTRDLVLAAGATDTVAESAAAQFTDRFQPFWDRAVDTDQQAGETRGTPENPNRYVRRLLLWETTYREDPTGQQYHDALWQQTKDSSAYSRMMEAATRRIGPAKDARVPVQVTRNADGLVHLGVADRTVASVDPAHTGPVLTAVTAVAGAYRINVVGPDLEEIRDRWETATEPVIRKAD